MSLSLQIYNKLHTNFTLNPKSMFQTVNDNARTLQMSFFLFLWPATFLVNKILLTAVTFWILLTEVKRAVYFAGKMYIQANVKRKKLRFIVPYIWLLYKIKVNCKYLQYTFLGLETFWKYYWVEFELNKYSLTK